MKRTSKLRIVLGLAACGLAFLAAPLAARAQTIKVLVVQEDWDKASIQRNNRIQRAVLNTFNAALNSPAYRERMQRQHGISGMDVYDETATTIRFYGQDRARRSDEELITIARQIKNPVIDVVVLYTIYAHAVKDPYTRIAKLQLSLNYRTLDTRSGRFLGGDNIDIDRDGVPLVGCATDIADTPADEHCVKEFVASHAERLARDAGNAMALRLAGLLGRQYGTRNPNYDPNDPGKMIDDNGNPVHTGRIASLHKGDRCPNIPTTFKLEYEGFSPKQMTFVEENMSQWRCALDLDTVTSSLTNMAYEYKTRANHGQTLRNIRLMLELMGLDGEARDHENNRIVVRVIGLRND